MKTCLLTGATGMVGNFLVSRALAEGRPLAALVRNKGKLLASERLPEGVRIITGDLTRSDLGISTSDRAWLNEHCDQVLHAGAKVNFQSDSSSGEPYLTNVDGTRHILYLCKELSIEHLAYVSTAYVCGDRTGLVREEELECGQNFHNDYERSKYMAECLIGQADFLKSKTIFRPSVVMGDSVSGRTPFYHTIYNLLRLVWLSRDVPREELLEKAQLNPETQVNLVAGDWVAEATWNLISREPGQRTYHLTHPEPVSVSQLLDAIDVAARNQEIDDIGAGLDDPGSLLRQWRGYLRHHPRFQSSVTNTPRMMAGDVLNALCQYAVDNQFLLTRSKVDGVKLLQGLASGQEAPQLTIDFVEGMKASLNFDGEITRTTAASETLGTAYLCKDVFDRLLSGELNLQGVLYQGALVLESDDMNATLQHLDSILDFLGASA